MGAERPALAINTARIRKGLVMPAEPEAVQKPSSPERRMRSRHALLPMMFGYRCRTEDKGGETDCALSSPSCLIVPLKPHPG